MGHGLSHNSHELSGVRPSRGVGSIPGPAGQHGARRRRPVHWFHQHHRLLCYGGSRLWPRTRLQPSLRQQELGPPHSVPAAHGAHPGPRNNTHRRAVAQSREDHGFRGARQSHHRHGCNLLPLLPPGPVNEYVAAAAAGVPEVAERDEAADVLHPGGSGLPRAAESCPGEANGAGSPRGGSGVGAHESQHGGAHGGVRVVGEGNDGVEMDGWDWRGVWWTWPTVEAGGAELLGYMFGMVVV